MFRELIAKLARHEDLTVAEASAAMETIMDGRAEPSQIAGLLVGLAMKGERPDEIVGLARTMRSRATKLSRLYAPVFDTCGTGGDGAHTFNVSTVAALVLAACGVRVAKHGNRSASSRCGSADLLEALGVNVGAPPPVVERCLEHAGIAFFFAQVFHPVDETCRADPEGAWYPHRVQSARPSDQPRRRCTSTGRRAQAGADRARGAIAGPARVRARMGGARRRWPRRDFDDGLHKGVRVPRRPRQHVLPAPGRRRPAQERARARCKAANPPTTWRSRERVLGGAAGGPRDVVLLNAGAALLISGQASSVREGIAVAAEAIDSGRAAAVLEKLITCSRQESAVA